MADVLVLCYHAVSPTWDAPLSLTPDRLEHQLSFLSRRGWQATTFSTALLDPPARRTLSITFDDAFLSVRDLAEPILTRLGMPGTVFAPTAFMAQRQPLSWPGISDWLETADAHELTGMDWGDLGELAERGWEIGSHTHTHPRLPELEDDGLRDELQRSLEECSTEMGRRCRSIAYPYGAVDDRVADGARNVGYETGAALPRRLAGREALRWPRVGVYHVDAGWRFALKVAPAGRRLRASPMWPEA